MPTINRPKKKPVRTNYKCPDLIAAYNRYRSVRPVYLMEHPLCEDCLANGITRAASEVHHLTPILKGKDRLEMISLAIDTNNMVALCKDCHYKRHHSP
jgi:5-methylcytosine-specific restriction protein A